ncbi:beta-lactamase-type transpeptidase [Clohesyomyces aquaticus]|uniref:Beta-lactamase-type transpeptidase n=1 Tax=Clohesyomyces aquaticus TaxID=1231657 RepID=A0A1Y1YEK3_9PLEO|nr:beta-lactamase-type transpeptidase [Clohesyomyces aquaticus]
MPVQAQDVQRILETVPVQHRGPGGALAVVKDGEVIAQKTWGYANLEKRIPISSKTIMPICSISKQMTCALLFDLEENPPPDIAAKGTFSECMEEALRKMVPEPLTKDTGLNIRHLCDMQSGLRDYWALAMICGAKPDDPFTIQDDGFKMLSLYTTFHFQPGTEYSYSNINFFLIARLIETVTKEPLPKLLEERVFRPANMTTAQLIPSTAHQPGDCLGYEGIEKYGFLPAVNRIEWSGDAGITTSLEDMIAYEKWFDTRWSEKSKYSSVASARTYNDGVHAPYSYGLGHSLLENVDTVGHAGALRGWRLQRRYVPQERLSVIAMFNSENATVGKTVTYIIRKALQLPDAPTSDVKPAGEWFGEFLDEGTQLSITVAEAATAGSVSIRYARDAEDVRLVSPTRAESQDNIATISGDTLEIHRVHENRKLVAQRIKQEPKTDGSELQGKYYCSELGSTLMCHGQDNMLYGAFDGVLGNGSVNLMRRLGKNVWVWACPRALDHSPPGDWTFVFKENAHGDIIGCTIGCWLARNLSFSKVPRC